METTLDALQAQGYRSPACLHRRIQYISMQQSQLSWVTGKMHLWMPLRALWKELSIGLRLQLLMKALVLNSLLSLFEPLLKRGVNWPYESLSKSRGAIDFRVEMLDAEWEALKKRRCDG